MRDPKALWTPDGFVSYGEKTPDRIELHKNLIEWFYQFDAFATSQRIGIHCALCGADIIGKNVQDARVFTATCGCREWVGLNREYVPPVNGLVN